MGDPIHVRLEIERGPFSITVSNMGIIMRNQNSVVRQATWRQLREFATGFRSGYRRARAEGRA